MSSHEQGIEQIRGLARRAEQRLRLARAVRVGGEALCSALVVAIAVVALRKAGLVREGSARGGLALTAVALAAAPVVAWAWRLPERAGALVLDRFHSLHDRLASALTFAEHPARTAFMEAAIDDAVRVAPTAEPRAAVPIPWSAAYGLAGGLAVALVAVGLFEVRRHTPLARARMLDPIDMASDDLDDVKDFLEQLQRRDSTKDDARAAIEEFNRLVDDIANHRLDRTEAFRRMEELEEKLATPDATERKALEEQVEALGHELEKAELTHPAGKALAEAKLDEARDALRDLSKKVDKARTTPIDKARLDQMREALKKAAADAEKRQHDLEQRREELADEVLKKKQQLGRRRVGRGARSLLQKKERELRAPRSRSSGPQERRTSSSTGWIASSPRPPRT